MKTNIIPKTLLTVLTVQLILSSCNLPERFIPKGSAAELPKFESCSDISALIKKQQQNVQKQYKGDDDMVRGNMMVEKATLAPGSISSSGSTGGDARPTSAPQASFDFSKTNTQVEGVDEADIVKTDGKYIYTLSKGQIYVVQALPANELRVLSNITFSDNYPTEFFINGTDLVVFSSSSLSLPEPSPLKDIEPLLPMPLPRRGGYYPTYRGATKIMIYNIDDVKKPTIKRTIEVEGSYLTSRMIGNNAFIVMNGSPQYYGRDDILPMPLLENTLVPQYKDSKNNATISPLLRCGEVHYFPEPKTSQYLTILSVPIHDYTADLNKEIIFGSGDNVYASMNNLYVAQTSYNYGSPWIEDSAKPSTSDNTETTNIYKFNLSSGKITYQNSGEVKGTILNQFSMDEYEGNFRIATTQQSYTTTNNLSSNLFILNDNMQQSGSIPNIAPGEKIYSARFMGKRAYLVTFKTVDPLFTFDLSDPKNPKVLGKLKIPGYSDYLHPYDENHLIGIGKEVNESIDAEKVHSANAVYYTAIQGVKLALFDVTDVNNPKEMYKVVIGDRGSESPALQNHKAFLFDRAKNLLVLPVTVSEITDPTIRSAVRNGDKVDQVFTTEFTFQGAYVYNLTLANGFDLKGKISHLTDPDVYKKAGYYMGDYDSQIQRSLYIDDHLYTISNAKIMAHNYKNNLIQEGTADLEPVTLLDTSINPNKNTHGWVTE